MPPTDLAALLAMNKYPGFLPAESMLARAWLIKHAGDYDRIEFNFRLGPGAPLGADASPEQQAYWNSITQLRADLVGWHGGGATVVEFKVRILPAGFGSCLAYLYWYRLTHPQVRPLDGLIVGATIGTAMPAVLEAYLLRYELLPEVFAG